ncbi:MAG: glycosyl-4,4'-diaponeurosporenoate acyltransferase [Clostridia bacterium]|nr:glycosyl-4,4'-diaponeurosporenoate acyltransferase [Clostridia bacterium]
MEWVDSFLYLVLISVIAFPLGRMLPKQWVNYDRFPFCTAEWEEDGKIYNRLGIRKWQHKLLDMSRIMTKYMKRKELPENYSEDDIRYLLDETCIAETVHAALCILGMHCMRLWSGIGGVIFYILYVTFGQLPYIMIQRYNRPRLARLYRRMNRERSHQYEGADTQLQYRRRS